MRRLLQLPHRGDVCWFDGLHTETNSEAEHVTHDDDEQTAHRDNM